MSVLTFNLWYDCVCLLCFHESKSAQSIIIELCIHFVRGREKGTYHAEDISTELLKDTITQVNLLIKASIKYTAHYYLFRLPQGWHTPLGSPLARRRHSSVQQHQPAYGPGGPPTRGRVAEAPLLRDRTTGLAAAAVSCPGRAHCLFLAAVAAFARRTGKYTPRSIQRKVQQDQICKHDRAGCVIVSEIALRYSQILIGRSERAPASSRLQKVSLKSSKYRVTITEDYHTALSWPPREGGNPCTV